MSGNGAVEIATADLCDAHPEEVAVCDPGLRDYGGQDRFAGPIATVQVFEDNVLVRSALETPGRGRVLVVDAGGSTRRALVGERLAALGVENGWSGIVLNGAVRDVAELAGAGIGIKALASTPLRSGKLGTGKTELEVRFAGVSFRPGEWLYADRDGIVVASRPIHEDGEGG